MSRVTLVTGGMGGLGEAICMKMADMGYDVATTYSPGNTKVEAWLAEMKEKGYTFRAYPCDVADYDSAQQLGLKPLARIKAYASAGLDPTIMGMGPVPASQRCLQKAGWSHRDLDLMEINEAFAAQAIAVNKEMGWDTSKINVNGGAIAIGHPIGASGCRILVTLIHEMIRRDAKRGLASLCIGGGMGVALAIER